MFVIVYLVESKAHTVIPQEFIFKLNQENLCNDGVNSNQHRLIYFSKEIFDLLQNGVDPQAFVPKFYIPVTNAYPLPDGVVETCFIARLKNFWGKCELIFKKKQLNLTERWIFARISVSFDDALAHVERMRPLLPAMYNEAREFEEPIPTFVWRDAQNQADELDLNLQNNEAIEEIDVKPIAFENILVDEFDAAALNILFNGEPLEDDNIVEAEQNSERSDTSVKQRPENDPLENDTATNEESVQQIKKISSDLAANIQIERGNVQVKTPIENVLPESSAQNTGKQAEQSVSSTTSQARNMTKCYDKKYDVEITFQSMDDFRPKVDSEYEMKPNDILSNNRPFMRNVRLNFLPFNVSF